MTRTSSRRRFLQQTALAGAGFWVLGGSTGAAADSRSPNEKLNIAGIGVGGQGAGDIGAVSGQNIVALCDVDEERAGKTFERFPRARRYTDFRKMLEEQKDIDAVVVATPDNVHAVASVMAMKMGKAVYCEKPLTHDVYEARVMRETAARQKVATQMGNQGTSGGGLRRAAELVQDGVIGAVKEAHVWTNRPGWPQGMKDLPPGEPVPKTLDWELWQGPAQDRPYNRAYLPFVWRGWWDFGTGALGDMACHTMNLAYLALKLGSLASVRAEASEFEPRAGYPTWATVHYEFPARGDLPAASLTWYEGHKDGKTVLPPPELLQGQREADTGYSIYFKEGKYWFRDASKKEGKPKDVSSGSFLVGDKGILFSPDDYGGESFLLRGGDIEKVKGEPERLPRSPGHHQEWIRAAKGGEPALSNFGYAGLLTETVLLGNVAIRARGQKLEWDGPGLRVTNVPEANAFLRREYRGGWSL
jgi:predicted dehydrogenase